MDAISTVQTEVTFIHRMFIGSWFCLLFTVNKMNLPFRNVSTGAFLVLLILAAGAIAAGFRTRKPFLKLAAEALPHDPRKANQFWRSANIVSFTCALAPAIYGVVLRILGSGWLVPGALFGLGLCFLFLWRPRQLALSAIQPAG
jgi:hypothetical protein